MCLHLGTQQGGCALFLWDLLHSIRLGLAQVGYMIMDLDKDSGDDMRKALIGLESSIRTRILY